MPMRLIGAVLTVAVASWAVRAQSTRPDPEPSGDLLAGPAVSDDDRGEPGMPVGRGRRVPAVPPRAWFSILGELELSDEQRREVEVIMRELRAERQAYRLAHGERIQELRREIQDGRTADRDVPRQPREELDRLAALGPRVADYQERIWWLLDDRQQERMRAAIAEIRRRRAERRAERGEGMRAGPRVDERDPSAVGLDEMARRRLDFLRARQSQRRRAANPQ